MEDKRFMNKKVLIGIIAGAVVFVSIVLGVIFSTPKDNVADVTTTYPPHVHVEVVDAMLDATCSATGLTEGKHCSDCGEVLVAQEKVDKLPHTEIIIPAVVATCTATGLTEGKKCSVCETITVPHPNR